MKGAMPLTVLAAVAGCSSNPMRASEFDARPAQVVRYADLEATGSTGALALYGRIEAAAVELCATQLSGAMSPHDVAHARVRYCIQRAIADAVAKVNTPALTDAHLHYRRLAPGASSAPSGSTEDTTRRLDSDSCHAKQRRVAIWPRGGHPGKDNRAPRFETRTLSVCDHDSRNEPSRSAGSQPMS